MTAPTPPSPEKRALIDAFDTVMKAGTEQAALQTRPAARRQGGTRPVAWVLLAASLAFLATAAIVRPPWLGFPEPLDEPPAIQAASLRLAIALEAQRIVRYRRDHGELPTRLEDAGPPMPDMTYHRGPDGRFELRGTNGAASATYRSTDPLRGFVGRSYDVLTRRGR